MAKISGLVLLMFLAWIQRTMSAEFQILPLALSLHMASSSWALRSPVTLVRIVCCFAASLTSGFSMCGLTPLPCVS